MSTDLYPLAAPVSSLLANNGISLWPLIGNEVDLRSELRDFLYGSDTEIAKGRLGIIRKMRKDSNGNLIQCACVDDITGEADIDSFCPYCFSGGWLFDEEWVVYYKMIVSSHEGLVRKNQPKKPGMSNIPFAFFYVEYSVEPERHDIIFEVRRSVEGSIYSPVVREAKFVISTCEDFRSDNGRVEYWRLAVTEDAVKSKWER